MSSSPPPSEPAAGADDASVAGERERGASPAAEGPSIEGASGTAPLGDEPTDHQLPDDDLPGLPRSSVRRNVFHMLSSQVVTWVLATALAVVVPRHLGPNIQGQLRLASSLWAIGAIVVDLGTDEFLRLEVARHRRSGLRLVGPVLVVRTLAFVAIAMAIMAYALATASDATLVVIVVLVGLTRLLGAWSGAFGAAFMGLERMSTPALVNALTKLLNTTAVLVVIWTGGTVFAILAVGIAVGFWSLAQFGWAYRRVGPVQIRGWRAEATPIVRKSVPFVAAGASLVLYTQIDIIVISWVAGDEALGWYGTADLLWGSLLFPATVIVTTTFPTMGRLHQDAPDQLVDLVERTFLLLMLTAIPIGLGVTLVAPSFAPVLYGEAFREAGVVLAVMGPVTIFTFATTLFGMLALATDRTSKWVVVMLVSAALTVPLDLLLVPWADGRFDNGAIGGAVAYVITESFQVVVGLLLIARFLLSRRTLWYVARLLIAGGVMFAVGWPLRDLPLPIPAATCAATYAIAILALRALTDEQRRLVGDVLARAGVRTRWGG